MCLKIIRCYGRKNKGEEVTLENKVPVFLVEMLEKQYGKEITDTILEGYKVKRKTTLRVNTLKAKASDIKSVLSKNNIYYEEVNWNENALIIKNASEEDLRKLDIYQNGKIYLQSLSSMLPPIILNPQEGENILDMAAAPGSKTTQMAALSDNKAMITACEMNKVRAERLKYNLEKQGATCVYTMVADARKLDDFFSFDKILLDAPCSGSGTIYENDIHLEKTFTMKLVNKSTETQITLLKKAVKLLKPGKEMLYSTCSILKEENEEVIEKALKGTNTEIVSIDLKKEFTDYRLRGINTTEKMTEIPLLPVKIPGTICVCPNELFEGFFIAKIRKR